MRTFNRINIKILSVLLYFIEIEEVRKDKYDDLQEPSALPPFFTYFEDFHIFGVSTTNVKISNGYIQTL